MDIQALHIGNKTAKLPLIQGGMGVGISLSGLAGAVAREGGIGIISTAQIGFREPDFAENSKKANLHAMVLELQKARALSQKADGACNGLLGYNIMVATRDYGDYVRTAAEAGADVIISGAGLPVDLPVYVEGTDTKIAPIVSSEKAARIILKMWDRRYHRTADFLVIESAHAGGHLGFSRETLMHLYEDCFDSDYDQEIKRIISCADSYAKKYRTRIPVIVAGGILNASQVRHVLSLGADGVQVATPFVTTEECDAALPFKQAYVNARAEDIEIVTSPVGMPARAIHNPFLEKIKKGSEAITRCYRCLEKCSPKTAPYCITQALIRAVEGDVENGLIFCGDNAPYLTGITTVPEVIRTLFP
ncbi:MAG: nitronate monooxygenase family protein [Lachnospiraceae bacterium]|nr:nitronate monooxygenase family protein [Lachnospiraceae bacterium]